MLNAMREGAKSGISKFILFGFMVMAVGGLVMMDVGGFFRGGVSQSTIVKVGKEALPIQIFDRTVRRVLSQQGLDVETAYKLGFIDQILKNEISNNLLQRASADIGLVIGEHIVFQQLNQLLEPMVSEDLTKKEALSNILRSQGMTETDLIKMIKAEMTNRLLRNALQSSTSIPPGKEAKDVYQYQNEERVVRYMTLTNKKIKDIEQPSDEVLLPFYQISQQRYAIPETRNFSLAILTTEKFKKTTDVSEDELLEIYQDEIQSYSLPESRVFEQAIIDSEEKAKDIKESIIKEGSLKKAVIKHTDSDDAYLGKDDFDKDGLPKEVREEAFNAELNETIGPIESLLGWHLLIVKKITPERTQEFKEIKDDLKRDILQLKVADEMFETSNIIDDSFASGMGLDEVAEEMGLQVKTFESILVNGTTFDKKDALKDFIEDKDYILETAFSLLDQEISPVFELTDGRYAVVKIDQISELSYKPFEDVKEELSAIWIKDQQDIANKHKTQDLLNKIVNGDSDFKSVASNNSVSIKEKTIVRAENDNDPFNGGAKSLFFATELNELAYVPTSGGYILGKVISIKLPEVDTAKEEKINHYENVVMRGSQEEYIGIYFDHLYDQYNVKVNKNLLDMTYGLGSEQF